MADFNGKRCDETSSLTAAKFGQAARVLPEAWVPRMDHLVAADAGRPAHALMQNRMRSSRPPVVLIADDQEWSVRSLESVLGPRGYAVLRAYTGRQALALARTARPDAMVLDYRMPDMSGAELLEELRADPRFPLTVPIIVIAAGGDSRSHRMDAYRAGAWEVCGEPLDAEILLHKLDRFLESKFFADQVREQSLVDPESGLYNLKGFARRARELGADLTRRGVALSCVAFSPTVESLAATTEAGADDAALAEYLGGICRRSTRMSDLVGRIGPSEFAVLAPGITDDGAARLADRDADSARVPTEPGVIGERRLCPEQHQCREHHEDPR